MFGYCRPLFRGTLIANVKMDRGRGNRLIAEGLADLVAFGRPYISQIPTSSIGLLPARPHLPGNESRMLFSVLRVRTDHS
jgi:hypothetical protein